MSPDILIGINALESDRLNRLVYHEVAHSSHFTNTSISYWTDVIIAESTAEIETGDPHGNANFADADIIAVVESWAEHIALSFAEMKYPTWDVTSINGTYIDLLDETWNEMPNHIPIGLYLDLIDEGWEPTSWNDDGSGSTTVTDNVFGFTNQQMFDCLNQNTLDINNFRIQLLNNYLNSTSNTQNNVNNLFISY